MVTSHHIKEFPVNADLHLYCGRESSFKLKDKLINAQMGNPFVVGKQYTREESVKAYEQNIPASHLSRIKRIKELSEEGKHVALYCFCKPLSCHCDIIRKLSDNH